MNLTRYQQEVASLLSNFEEITPEEADEIASQVVEYEDFDYSIFGAIEGFIHVAYPEYNDQPRIQRERAEVIFNEMKLDVVLENTNKLKKRIKKLCQSFATDEEIYEMIFTVLSFIHDAWVQHNWSKSIIEQKNAQKKLRQYVPLDMLGLEEVRKDLLFCNNMLQECGIVIDDEQFNEFYYRRMERFIRNKNLHLEDIPLCVDSAHFQTIYTIPTVDMSELYQNLKGHGQDMLSHIEEYFKNNDSTGYFLLHGGSRIVSDKTE